jgi:predicted Rossmann fold nucleotide-binding protein DprA/Smf involved in DNA uptake
MGIDIYARWKGQTRQEQEAQYTGFSVVHGHLGYLREAYHGEPYATNMKSQQTQGARVQQLVARKAKSIKQIAKETGFLEPNIRRILGQGEKKGIFRRVAKGMYILNHESTYQPYKR